MRFFTGEIFFYQGSSVFEVFMKMEELLDQGIRYYRTNREAMIIARFQKSDFLEFVKLGNYLIGHCMKIGWRCEREQIKLNGIQTLFLYSGRGGDKWSVAVMVSE